MLLKPCTQNYGINFGKSMAKYDSTIAICIRLLIDLKIKRTICCDQKGKKLEQNTIIDDGYWCTRKIYFVLLQNNASQDFRLQIMNDLCHTKHWHHCKLSEALCCIHYIKQIKFLFVMENQLMIQFVVLINTVRVTKFVFSTVYHLTCWVRQYWRVSYGITLTYSFSTLRKH